MKRFLVAFLHEPRFESKIMTKAYRINYSTSPDEVSYPDNTLFFMFVECDVKTTEELECSFIVFKIGNAINLSSSLPLYIQNNGKRYFIGKLQKQGKLEFVVNPKTHTALPVNLFGSNYEVIEP